MQEGEEVVPRGGDKDAAGEAADGGARRGVLPREGGRAAGRSGRPDGSLGRELGGQARAVGQHFPHGNTSSTQISSIIQLPPLKITAILVPMLHIRTSQMVLHALRSAGVGDHGT